MQRDERDDGVQVDAAKSCRATFTASGRAAEGAAVYADDYAADGRQGGGRGDELRRGRDGVRGDDAGADDDWHRGDGEHRLPVHGLVGRLQRDDGGGLGELAGRADVHGELPADRRADLCADDCAGADGRDGDGERADVRDGRRGVRGDAGSGTTATLTAAPASGYTFTSWGGACSGTSTTTAVQVDAAKSCSATFTATSGGLPTGPPYTLTITPPTGGTVTGAGMSCGAGGTACAVTMPAPMTIGIEATAIAGYTFTGWSGDCSGTASGLWVNLQGARTCTATFAPTGGGAH